MSEIKWWQVWRYAELKRQNEESLVALVRERPDFTAADARYLMALCKSGARTPDWLVDKMVGETSKTKAAKHDGEEMQATEGKL